MREDRDPVPTWDGSPDSWEKYQLQVEYFFKTKPHWEKPYLLAKLIKALTGKCWTLIEKLPQTSRLQLEKSPEIFLSFLKKHLLEGVLPELGRVFRNYLPIRRNRSESKMLYCLRHREALSKLRKAMSSIETDGLQRYLVAGLENVKQELDEEDTDEEEEEEAEAESDIVSRSTHSSKLSYKKWVPKSQPQPRTSWIGQAAADIRARGRAAMGKKTPRVPRSSKSQKGDGVTANGRPGRKVSGQSQSWNFHCFQRRNSFRT
jgi:hypothetical protein